jgi:hypothetical protein
MKGKKQGPQLQNPMQHINHAKQQQQEQRGQQQLYFSSNSVSNSALKESDPIFTPEA